MKTSRQETIEELLRYGETDLLLYREDREAALQRQQQEQWQPWLDWAEGAFGTAYRVTQGIIPIRQPEQNHHIYQRILAELSDEQCLALLEIVGVTTSLVLGLAFLRTVRLKPDELLSISRLEEDFNITRWGEDAEAAARRESARARLEAAAERLKKPGKSGG
jgi:chaperone required for assembly of F1-ATPase